MRGLGRAERRIREPPTRLRPRPSPCAVRGAPRVAGDARSTVRVRTSARSSIGSSSDCASSLRIAETQRDDAAEGARTGATPAEKRDDAPAAPYGAACAACKRGRRPS